MNFKKLKLMQCPTCSRILERNAKLTGYKCACGFFITNQKFEIIVNKIISDSKKRYNPNDEEKNLAELNNLLTN